ncbi:Wzz/FepE/Etk N-terminal domain-containing protein [Pseudoalteromonas sp. Z1A2]|uniref:Wzz/FepE/Etk N-terminal domain-containing protein n=1 Tax=Pseudoalteromonas sp. Z1A2 TaxID=2686350 RepID=UPI0013FDB9D2|nr:Wzz/FepE/Etk N-terminal domain-containing protein [Pseudoalteromonas sp. Z1A2]|tara:strand:+ start:432 stop:1385 length:954 start_codon:yes stop_codon:yes gene_type:complete
MTKQSGKVGYEANASYNQDDELDIRELITSIWAGKLFIFIVTSFFAVASVIYALNLPNIYKAEAVLIAAESKESNGLAGLASEFGGLAGLAGVDIGGGSGNKTQLALEILKSRKFISNFIEKHAILPDLMAAKSWDMSSNSISYNEALYLPLEDKWIREVKAPKRAKPSMQEAYKVFSKIVDTNSEPESSTITLSVEHISPVIAQQWVNWLIEDINREVKQREVAEAIKSTQFLTEQLEKTKVSDIRSVLYNLVEEQTKTIMFANVRDEYVFKTIDPAIVPEEKFKPRRAVICIAGTFLGVVLSFFFLVLRFFLKQN